MSFFGDGRYQWRETYFVMLRSTRRPLARELARRLGALERRFEVSETVADEQGRLESISLRSPDDFAAIDISFVDGEEVLEQREELLRQLARATLNEEQQEKLNQIGDCDVRYDVYHFEDVAAEEDDDEMLDPGALLLVLDVLAALCGGVAVDPQSGAIL